MSRVASASEHPRCRPAQEVMDQGTLSAEVVVVGTGAGGAMAGTEMARAGKKVLFLEAGGAFGQKDFKKRSLVWSTSHLYLNHGPNLAMGKPNILIPAGRTVGGSTVLNSAICFRPPKERLQEWEARLGHPGIGPEAMKPHVDEVWRRLGVTPTHPGNGRMHNLLFQRGVVALGIKEHNWIDRNAPTCMGCGICHLGCPTGAKLSVDRALLPDALENGAEILTRARADGVIVEGGRATGVQVTVVDPKTEERVGTLKVKADLVIVSGSAMGSPRILDLSGVQNAHLGRHLSIHPATPVLAEFDGPVVMWDGVPQGYWAKSPKAPETTLETANVGPNELFALLGAAGQDGGEISRRFAHYALAGPMLRDVGEGSVSTGEKGRISIKYDLQPIDLERLVAGAKLAVQIYFAAGARRVSPLVHPIRFHEREADALAQLEGVREATDMAYIYASHPHGTCRMGKAQGEYAGVVDKDGKVHGQEGLYVMDGSIFPTTLGVNPQISIMSLTQALSRRLVA
jgi:choline dehydrogenase-like flavoprotein